jgi:hypothetical protein
MTKNTQTARRPRRMAREPEEACHAAVPATDAAQHDASPDLAAGKAPRAGSKAEQVIALMTRAEGATMGELTDLTGWLPHTTRAALTGLRKKGHVIERCKRDEVTCYRIVGAA